HSAASLILTLSLHDALPIFNLRRMRPDGQTLDTAQVDAIATELNVRPEDVSEMEIRMSGREMALEAPGDDEDAYSPISYLSDDRSEEHTSELQSRENLVCRL